MHNPPEYQALCLKGREGHPGVLLSLALILPTLPLGSRYDADLTDGAAGKGIGRDLSRFQGAQRGDVKFFPVDEGLLAAAENEKGFIDSILKRT